MWLSVVDEVVLVSWGEHSGDELVNSEVSSSSGSDVGRFFDVVWCTSGIVEFLHVLIHGLLWEILSSVQSFIELDVNLIVESWGGVGRFRNITSESNLSMELLGHVVGSSSVINLPDGLGVDNTLVSWGESPQVAVELIIGWLIVNFMTNKTRCSLLEVEVVVFVVKSVVSIITIVI